jgi:hypothetical protein
MMMCANTSTSSSHIFYITTLASVKRSAFTKLHTVHHRASGVLRQVPTIQSPRQARTSKSNTRKQATTPSHVSPAPTQLPPQLTHDVAILQQVVKQLPLISAPTSRTTHKCHVITPTPLALALRRRRIIINII